MGLPQQLSDKETTCRAGDSGDAGSIPASFFPPGKIPWRWKWQPTPVFLLEKIPGTEEPCGLQSKGSQSQTGQSK